MRGAHDILSRQGALLYLLPRLGALLGAQESLTMVTPLLCERGFKARAEEEVRGEPQLWNPF